MNITQDKIEHWAFGFVLSFLGIFFFPLIFLGYAFAFGKEIYDRHYGRGWSNGDITATVAGALTAWTFIIM